jgi:hypothetical protein
VTLALNGIRASAVRLVTPWNGAWVADVDLDLGRLPDLPTGPATLIIDRTPLVGTIDPAQSGRFGPTARARVVAGAGGWEKSVSAQHYHNDAGVISTAVLAMTAAAVLERVVEIAGPTRFGVDYIRTEGPASSVLSDLEWHVDATGTTIVGPRVPMPAPPTMRVLEWNASTKVATIGAEEIVQPATILSDTRFGQAKIRDVEQTWGNQGARATAWTIPVDETPKGGAGGELVGVMRAVAREATGSDFRGTIRYRVLAQGPDGRFNLKPDDGDSVHPVLKSISLAPAVPGMSVKVPPGTVAHVIFLDGSRGNPRVVGFGEGTPIEVTISPAVRFVVGGPTALPVAMAAPTAAGFAAVAAALTAMGVVLPLLAPAAAAFASALAPLTPTIPAQKVFAE